MFANRERKDNYCKPREEYISKLAAMTDVELRKECNSKIWLSAYANNNPRSDYHFQCDYCYDECVRRDKVNIYSEELVKLMKEASR